MSLATSLRSWLGSLALVLASVGLTTGVFAVALEGWQRLRHPLPEPRHLVFDEELGWDSVPALETLPATSGPDVYFIGDSFTDEKAWYRHAATALAEAGTPIRAHSLGVSGFGLTQSWLKLRRNFDTHRPAVVVLLVFAWNDMRDDYPYPRIFYNPSRHARPYVETDAQGSIRVAFERSSLLRSRAYVRTLLPVSLRLTRWLAARDVDLFSRREWSPLLEYAEPSGWQPFYQPTRAESAYVSGAYRRLETGLLAIRDFTQAQGAQLVVLALDNAFGVDPDVAERWIDPRAELDLGLPLRRLGEIARSHGIHFVDARPALLQERARLGRKIYLGAPGDIAGHLTDAGERVLGELAATALRSAIATEHAANGVR